MEEEIVLMIMKTEHSVTLTSTLKADIGLEKGEKV